MGRFNLSSKHFYRASSPSKDPALCRVTSVPTLKCVGFTYLGIVWVLKPQHTHFQHYHTTFSIGHVLGLVSSLSFFLGHLN